MKEECEICGMRKAIAWIGNPVKPTCAYCWNIIIQKKKEIQLKQIETK